MADKPNVLILGGVNTFSRHLAALLVPEAGDRLVNHLRIVDKYSVAPPTTYVGAGFPRTLAKDNVEYKQLNLQFPEKVKLAFDPIEGAGAFDYVFDLTGEVRPERLEQIQIEQTCHLSRFCALEAASRKVKAYIRLQLPCYDCPDKGQRSESDRQKPTKVWGVWWHETLRILADIPDLNLAIVRVGLGYGPSLIYGYITPAVVIGRVYQHLQEKMTYLWSPSTPVNTVHTADIAGGLWAVAVWMAQTGRAKANEVAGEEIWWANDKSMIKEVPEIPDPAKKLIAPLFNLVDDSELTQQALGQAIAGYFKIEYGQLQAVANAWAKLNKKEFIESANEAHTEAWTEIITTSDPPVPNTPLTAYMDTSMFSKPGTAYSNEKIKKIIGYQLTHPKFGPEEIEKIVESFKEEGCWPNPGVAKTGD